MHTLMVALISGPAILCVCKDIMNVYNAALNHGSACRRTSILMDGILFDDYKIFVRMAVAGRSSINLAVLSVEEAPLCVA
jgi:hypothetical protein